MRRQFGYRKLGRSTKRKILGRNAAKLYRIKTRAKVCEIAEDEIARIQKEQGGPEQTRTHLVYGPQTDEEFRRLLAHGAGRNAV